MSWLFLAVGCLCLARAFVTLLASLVKLADCLLNKTSRSFSFIPEMWLLAIGWFCIIASFVRGAW